MKEAKSLTKSQRQEAATLAEEMGTGKISFEEYHLELLSLYSEE